MSSSSSPLKTFVFSTTAFALGILLIAAAFTPVATAQSNSRGWIGARVDGYSADLAKKHGLIMPGGVIVRSLDDDGPAKKAGLAPGDQIIYIGTDLIPDNKTFERAIIGASPGTNLELSILRPGEAPRKIKVTTASRPRGLLGADVQELTRRQLADLGLDHGVKLIPHGNGPAKTAGLKSGDIALKFDGNDITNVDAFISELGTRVPGDRVTFIISRAGKIMDLAITLGRHVGVTNDGGGTQNDDPDLASLSEPPRLMLDTGGHMSLIKGLEFTADGTRIVSSSDDKTVRIWDWRADKTERVIRGQALAGDYGKVYAMSLSPDNKWLAVAGWMKFPGNNTAHHIRLYDFKSGKLVRLLKGGHDNVVNALAFGPGSKRLMSGAGDDNAVIWNIETGKVLHILKGHTAPIYAVKFMPDGKRVITGCDDTTLRMWNAKTGKLIKVMEGHKRDVDRAVAISPDGTLIASGDSTGEIRLWDGRSGKYLRSLESPSTGVGAMHFTPDSKRLMAASGTIAGADIVSVWDIKAGKELVRYKGHDNVIIAGSISRDGRLAATAGGNTRSIHIWDLTTGKRVNGHDNKRLKLAGNGASVFAAGFSQVGSRIAWGKRPGYRSHNNRSRFRFQLRLPREGGALGAPELIQQDANDETQSSWLRGNNTHGNLSLAHRKGGPYGYDAILDVFRDGNVIASLQHVSSDGYDHRSYTFTPDGRSIISGGVGGSISVYDIATIEAAAKGSENRLLTGGPLINISQNLVGHEGDVWAVTPSADGRFLVTSSADQTVRLWNLKTYELIVTMFHGEDDEWVMWTPQGYYTGSPKGGEMVGWQINQGASRAANYVRGQQFRKALNRPDIIDKAIRLASARAAIRQAGLTNVSIGNLLTAPPPIISMFGPPKAFGGRGRIYVTSERNSRPIIRLDVFVTNAKGEETKVKAAEVKLPPEAQAPPKGGTLKGYDVPLFSGENRVRVVAVNEGGDSEPASAIITHNGEGALDKRETLWILAVGVNQYPGAQKIVEAATGKTYRFKDLNFAGKDASAFAATASREIGRTHRRVEVRLLVDNKVKVDVKGNVIRSPPTRANILAALNELAEKAGDSDTVAVFMSGHGENWQNGKYHFLPTDFTRKIKAKKGNNVIDWAEDVSPLFAQVAGRRLMFLDACHAASSRNRTLLSEANASSFTAFQAASANQRAWEFKKEGHGAFTYVLLKGLKGAAEAIDRNTKAVTVYSLGPYLKRAVQRRTDGEQTPEFAGQSDFVLAR